MSGATTRSDRQVRLPVNKDSDLVFVDLMAVAAGLWSGVVPSGLSDVSSPPEILTGFQS